MSVWSGKRSPCLLSPSPCLSPCLLSLSRSRSGPSGPKDVVHFLTFSTPNGHVPKKSLLVQKVMRKQLRFSLLFDMVQLDDFWSEKSSNSAIFSCLKSTSRKSEISIFGKVHLRQENKGLEHRFLDKKSPNGTMSKSSVKT